MEFIQKIKGSLKIKSPKLTRKDWFEIGRLAVGHFKRGFAKGGYMTDASQSGWLPRKRPYHYEKIGGEWRKIDDTDKQVLTQRGHLKDSITIVTARRNSVIIGSRGLPYAAIHNFGLMGRAFGRYPFKMPKREFIGRSKSLEERIKKLIEKKLKPNEK